ncbi:thioesterase II family protein [Paenibacillus polymyxa]|uniref:thioesterase II family protein n=1 Tax=Paenibacillus polymyxa TaxID=1406 RepID=UPI0032166686
MSKRVLYFFPYSGASKVTFNEWKSVLEPEIEFKALDYAGHGKRRTEDYYQSVNEACIDIYESIKKDLQDYDYYYLAGHCLGAIIAIELYYHILLKKEVEQPDGIFISGQGAPDRIYGEKLSTMEDRKLLQYLHSLGSIDESMLDEELYSFVEEFVLAPVKADSMIYEQYILEADRDPIKSSMYVMYGRNDQTYAANEMNRWSKFSSKPVQYYSYEGGHYFINSHTLEYITDIKDAITAYEENSCTFAP